jgi:hypothetical protein
MAAMADMTTGVMNTEAVVMTATAMSIAGAIMGLMVTGNGFMLRRRLSMRRLHRRASVYLYAKSIASGREFISDPKQHAVL